MADVTLNRVNHTRQQVLQKWLLQKPAGLICCVFHHAVAFLCYF